MSGFSADWLALREPADTRARDRSGITAAVADWAAERAGSVGASRPLRVLDLGSGSGANPRYAGLRLGIQQEWALLEHDPALLATAPAVMRAWARARGIPVADEAGGLRLTLPDLAMLLHWTAADLATPGGLAVPADTDLVTASALLDLVSPAWIGALAHSSAATGCAALFALNYDGRIRWQPALGFDAVVRRLVNRHQRGDKGFGPAAGPTAAACAAASLRDLGYRVQTARSDWSIGVTAGPLQATLARGWAAAAAELAPGRQCEIARWLRRRLERIARHQSRLWVGHVDLFAAPPRG